MLNAANTETDDYKAIRKTTTRLFQPRNTFKFQMMLEKNTNLIFFCLEKRPMTSFGDGILFEITFANSRRGLLPEIKSTELLLKADLRYRPFQGFRRHLGGGAVAAKITANVWEIVQLSNLVTPLLYNGICQKLCLLIGIDKDTVCSKQKEYIRAKTIVIKILKLHTIT